MATANYTAVLDELTEAHACKLAAMDDAELLELEPSSPLEAELMFRMGLLLEMYGDKEEDIAGLRADLAIREWAAGAQALRQ